MITHPEIYKQDSAGKTRVWFQQSEGNRYRTVAGLLGGNLVESGWTVCVGKQGRDDVGQCQFEVEAAYRNKLSREYHSSLESISTPNFFKPMLAHTYEKFPGPCYSQPKLDGARCIATKDGLFSRQGKPFVSVPHIWEALRGEFEKYPTLILDGELYNHDLKDDFGQIMSLIRQQKPTAEDLDRSRELIQFHVYDLPASTEGFAMRLTALEQIITRIDHDAIRLVDTHTISCVGELDSAYQIWLAEGWEGQIIRLDRPYEQKRSKSLLKRKEFQDAEFPVVSIDEGLGNWSGVAKSVTCQLPDGRTFGAGIKGTRERAAELLHETHKFVTVRFFEYTPDGVPRFPIAVDFHEVERTT